MFIYIYIHTHIYICIHTHSYIHTYIHIESFPGGSVVKNLPANSGDVDSIPWLGRSPGEGNGNSLQFYCLGNPIDGGAWQAVTKSWT